MRVEGEVIQVIETGNVIEIESVSGTDIEIGTWIVKGLEIGMGEVVGMEEELGIGDLEMEGMEPGTGIVIEAGHAPLLGTDTGGHLEVQFTHISEIVDRCLSFEI